MNKIIKKVLSKHLLNDKIFISDNFKKAKLDVGLSMNAPNSEYWLRDESDLIVFGFEPSTKCHNSFINENESMRKRFTEYVFIEPDRINKTFFPIKCALSNGEPRYQKFYNTGNDLGCSSLYEPCYFPILDIEEVPVISLKDFFDLFPWEQIQYIDQLKIDTQGSDYNILLGAQDYLNNIVYITLENSTQDQYKKENDYYKFDFYLKKFGFLKIEEQGINSTYLNFNHIDKVNNINFFIENK